MRGATRARELRHPNDQYFTPAALATGICVALKERHINPENILVPGAGEGAFLRAAAAVWPEARQVGLDLDPKIAGMLKTDFLTFEPSKEQGGIYDLVIGNPPYNLAEEFVFQSFKHLKLHGHLAFLLRLSFLGSQGRAKTLWGIGNLRFLAPIVPRPCFTGDGLTDASEYGLFVWQKDPLRRDPRLVRPLWWIP